MTATIKQARDQVVDAIKLRDNRLCLIMRQDNWWAADHVRSGVFLHSFVKLIPKGTFWSACFHPVDPVIDVDIILPVTWVGDVLEEVDLELDILRSMDGTVWVRDQDSFAGVRVERGMPNDVATQAEETCNADRSLVEQSREPFGSVGHSWLSRFLTDIDLTHGLNPEPRS